MQIEEEIKSQVSKRSKGSNENKSSRILDKYLNPKSAEPHLHKSKAKDLQPLAELNHYYNIQ